MLGTKQVKKKIDTVINDRVTQPITIGLAVSLLALTVAGIALFVAVCNADH